VARIRAGDRVSWKDADGKRHTGRVLGDGGNALLGRVAEEGTGRRFEVGKRSLRRLPVGVLLLEAGLDRSLRSDRRAADFFAAYFLQAWELRIPTERVHSAEDFEDFTRRYRSRARVVHLVCHGDTDGSSTWVSFTREAAFLREDGTLADLPWTKYLRGKILLLSCCEVGGDDEAMLHLGRTAQLDALICYRHYVYDDYNYIAEPLLYDLLLRSRQPQTLQRVRAVVESVATFLYQNDVDARWLREEGQQIRTPTLRVFTRSDWKS
jgi:hypothetical protein